MAITYSNPVERSKRVFEAITAAKTLTAADSGTIFTLPAATAGAAITLPAPAAGLYFKFLVTGLFATTAWTIVTNAAAKIIYGGAIVNSVNVPAATETTITFAHAAETIGDFVELESDGTSWFATGCAFAAGGITFTGA